MKVFPDYRKNEDYFKSLTAKQSWRHIRNIFEQGELEQNSVVVFFATTATDGKIYQF